MRYSTSVIFGGFSFVYLLMIFINQNLLYRFLEIATPLMVYGWLVVFTLVSIYWIIQGVIVRFFDMSLGIDAEYGIANDYVTYIVRIYLSLFLVYLLTSFSYSLLNNAFLEPYNSGWLTTISNRPSEIHAFLMNGFVTFLYVLGVRFVYFIATIFSSQRVESGIIALFIFLLFDYFYIYWQSGVFVTLGEFLIRVLTFSI